MMRSSEMKQCYLALWTTTKYDF